MHPDMETTEKDDEVFIEILIQASPERVYQAWTDPGQLIRWYAPEGCSIRFKELDIREGGNFHSCIHNPEYGIVGPSESIWSLFRTGRLYSL